MRTSREIYKKSQIAEIAIASRANAGANGKFGNEERERDARLPNKFLSLRAISFFFFSNFLIKSDLTPRALTYLIVIV